VIYNLEIMSTRVAIDFGITNTDCVAVLGGEMHSWTRPTSGVPDEAMVRALLAAGGIQLEKVGQLAVTGGRHQALPERLDGVHLERVNEVTAIGRGGQRMAGGRDVLVVSCGSGTAAVSARGDQYRHVSGSGVGGGTLLGLSRLLLGTVDPEEINALALAGDRNGVDLALRDVISGPIGTLPPDATAVNFGRLGRQAFATRREDLAAGLITLVGQVIGVIAINAARANGHDGILLIGHLVDMASMRAAILAVGGLYQMAIDIPAQPGYGTALGALTEAANPAS
jgi:type II pantothenate kinase